MNICLMAKFVLRAVAVINPSVLVNASPEVKPVRVSAVRRPKVNGDDDEMAVLRRLILVAVVSSNR